MSQFIQFDRFAVNMASITHGNIEWLDSRAWTRFAQFLRCFLYFTWCLCREKHDIGSHCEGYSSWTSLKVFQFTLIYINTSICVCVCVLPMFHFIDTNQCAYTIVLHDSRHKSLRSLGHTILIRQKSCCWDCDIIIIIWCSILIIVLSYYMFKRSSLNNISVCKTYIISMCCGKNRYSDTVFIVSDMSNRSFVLMPSTQHVRVTSKFRWHTRNTLHDPLTWFLGDNLTIELDEYRVVKSIKLANVRAKNDVNI